MHHYRFSSEAVWKEGGEKKQEGGNEGGRGYVQKKIGGKIGEMGNEKRDRVGNSRMLRKSCPRLYKSLARRTPPPLPCISIPLPCVLRSVGSGMDDLNVFGSVGNRKLLLLLIVSSSLLRDVHLAEFPSEDEDSEGRGGCCGQDVRCSSEPPVSSLLYSLEVEGSFKRGCMYRCMYRAIKFLESHAYRLIDS